QEDRSQYMAAMLAFWAFFSVFPLMLVLISLLGFFLPGSMKTQVLGHVSSMFPMLNPSQVGHLSGSVWTIVLGGVTALWSGSAVMRTAEYAFNSLWEIPVSDRPKMVGKLANSLWSLSTIGLGLVVSSVISGFVTGQDKGVNLGWAGYVAGYLVALALDVGVFVAAFRMLTDRDITFRDVLPGALVAGGAFWIFEQLSSLIVTRHLHQAQSTYGHFATVITILWWFYLQGLVTLIGAQLNVVIKRGLYPRSLTKSGQTESDRRAREIYAQERT
ncbi:MAG TPA: YihY/virulence factor BrkB family protein, partial [Acidimicrobiales bacterium]|nr:YihY/virulence factor BrkB family protein [Acidimicrobiales bacterium]